MIHPLHAGYLTLTHRPSEEEAAFFERLRAEEEVDLRVVACESPLPEDLDALWLHLADEAAWTAWQARPDAGEALRRYVHRGGRLLATHYAALLPHALGFETRNPEVRPLDIQDRGFGRGHGFQSFRGHPVFEGLHGGACVWFAHEDHTERRIGYFDDEWPAQGRVVGVERSYITLHQRHRLVVEHTPGGGRMLSVGAFIHVSSRNLLAGHTLRFIRNALRYLARPDAGRPATWWIEETDGPRAVAVPPGPPVAVAQNLEPYERTGLALSFPDAADAFFDVAGRRCLMMGRERGGIDEVWIHPFRVLRDFEVGLLDDGGVRPLSSAPARVVIRPEAVVRTYRLPAGTLTETLFAALEAPGGLVHLRAEGTGPLDLLVRFRCDLRWMWPYAENTLGALHFGYDAGLQALHVHDRSGDFYALFGAGLRPEDQLGGAFAQIDYEAGRLQGRPTRANEVRQAFRFRLDDANLHTLSFAVAGSSRGRGEAEAAYRALLGRPHEVYRDAVRHYRHALETSTLLTTPDEDFNTGYRWALAGTDRFRATTPGLGTGLLAGYGTSASGWDGGHAVSGRPGYAWYFGRDAAWAGFAVDGYGDFDTVRRQLLLFRDFQDLSGKIFHELTLSGVVHYDAADATPLYILLAAHYVRSTADFDTLRTLWPSLRRAMDFLYATDTDGDGLIENTNVGHGWIEGGALFGAHTTLYLAGLWAQALRDAAYLATLLNLPDEADRYAGDACAVLDTIERDFWDEKQAWYRYGKLRDGTFNPEPTVLPAVLMHFHLLDASRVQTLLDACASNDFSVDWGVRIVSVRSPLFNPEGYHYGSVWPLFTGWAALAAYACGRSAQGFTHLMSNLLLYRHGARGWIDEVLHGMSYAPTGVCPHQCWSETNVLHPVYAGLLGFHPDAPGSALRLAPRIPLHWDDFRVDNLRAGATRLGFEMERRAGRTTYRFARTEGPAVTVHFTPELPDGTRVSRVLLDGSDRPGSRRGPSGLMEPPLVFTLSGETVVEIRHAGGIGVIPTVLRPEPGETSQGYRILRAEMRGDAYAVTVEGRAGTEGCFQVRTFGRPVARIEGAETAGPPEDGRVTWRVSFEGDEAPYPRRTVLFHFA